jgi:hypothetical protein
MENKQTAVAWLEDQIECFGNKHELQMSWATLDELLDQAKAMEKEQIKGSWNHGFDWGMMEQSLAEQGEQSTLIDANYYYNETYGGDK